MFAEVKQDAQKAGGQWGLLVGPLPSLSLRGLSEPE